MADEKKTAFETADSGKDAGLLREFVWFIKHNKKYWLIPLVLVLLLFGALLILGSTAAAPFIYTLF